MVAVNFSFGFPCCMEKITQIFEIQILKNNKEEKMSNDIKKVKEFLILCSRCCEEDKNFIEEDKAVKLVFEEFTNNTDISQILVKVVVLNTLYKTRIWDVVKISRHIFNLNIDEELCQGNLKLVSQIMRVNDRNFYSFATKYCHWHRPKIYPIYDQYAENSLYELQKQFKFFKERVTHKNLNDYKKYKEVLDCCIDFFGFDNIWRYKKIDQALWIYGKFLEEELPEELQNQLKIQERSLFTNVR
jgi:hypothetical protein